MKNRSRIAAALVVALFLAGCAGRHAPEAETNRISELLEVVAGMDVADVGAGDGRWAEALAERVGDTGRVYATEVDEEELEEIRERLESAGLENVTVIQGESEDTGLPEVCCDGILLRLVYHHFTDPAPMRVSLEAALRPSGLLLIVETVPQRGWKDVPGVPDRGGHGILVEDLIEEMTVDGWEVVERHDGWDGNDERYCVVFRR